MTVEDLEKLVRPIPDFPKPGILFRDITTLIGHGEGFRTCVAMLADKAQAAGAQAIAGVEARGFIFGAAVAAHLGLPFILVRKPGKLPVPVIAIAYALEYGSDTLELDPGSVARDQKVVVVDDLIATGGTVQAAVRLIRQAGGLVDDAMFAIELPDLGGRARLAELDVAVTTIMTFPGH